MDTYDKIQVTIASEIEILSGQFLLLTITAELTCKERTCGPSSESTPKRDRGYYMPTRGYEYYLRVLKISEDFPKISEDFRRFSEDCPKFIQNSDHFPKITEGCRIFPSNLRRCFNHILNLVNFTWQQMWHHWYLHMWRHQMYLHTWR